MANQWNSVNDPTGGKRVIDQMVAKYAPGVQPDPDDIAAINDFASRKAAAQQQQTTSSKITVEMKVKQTKVGEKVTLTVEEMDTYNF